MRENRFQMVNENMILFKARLIDAENDTDYKVMGECEREDSVG